MLTLFKLKRSTNRNPILIINSFRSTQAGVIWHLPPKMSSCYNSYVFYLQPLCMTLSEAQDAVIF